MVGVAKVWKEYQRDLKEKKSIEDTMDNKLDD